jgi:hypothetical protein
VAMGKAAGALKEEMKTSNGPAADPVSLLSPPHTCLFKERPDIGAAVAAEPDRSE